MHYIKLLRPKDWAKNLFLFIPLFFAGQIDDFPKILEVCQGFIAFSAIASSIYIINDYRDREDDRRHPVKCKRPLASGAVSPSMAVAVTILLILTGFTVAWMIGPKFCFILGIYFAINIGYCLGLKNIPILDIVLVSIGFVLRVKAGSTIADIYLSEWIIVMVFLLALFMATGKRRDDVLLKLSSGEDMRKSVKGYNLEFLNTLLSLICAVVIVAYFMYTMSAETMLKFGTHRLYYTCLFVMMGIIRYLQIILVFGDAGSPTKILYRDRFIQVALLCWIGSFFLIIYIPQLRKLIL